MRPAREGGIPVRVKNSYNRHAPGTVITKSRDMSKVCCVGEMIVPC
jgi:aspartate kinase